MLIVELYTDSWHLVLNMCWSCHCNSIVGRTLDGLLRYLDSCHVMLALLIVAMLNPFDLMLRAYSKSLMIGCCPDATLLIGRLWILFYRKFEGSFEVVIIAGCCLVMLHDVLAHRKIITCCNKLKLANNGLRHVVACYAICYLPLLAVLNWQMITVSRH